jgi:hypothetical protein
MLFLFFISITLIGTALLAAFILFSHRREKNAPVDEGWFDQASARETTAGKEGTLAGGYAPGGFPGTREGYTPRAVTGEAKGETGPGRMPSIEGRSAAGTKKAGSSPPSAFEGGPRGAGAGRSGPSPASPAGSIPIIRPEKPIPGLGSFEIVHFFSKASMYTFEDPREPREVRLDSPETQLQSYQIVLEGDLALTSKNLLLFDEKTSKKIPFGSIETYHLLGGSMIIKKKNVKKKKTVVKVFGNFDDFQYILSALLPL